MVPYILFLEGWIIGLVIAAPVGPVGVLCIRRTLFQGWHSGLIAGSGAAIADTFYGAVAAFGIVLVSDFILDHQTILKILGGVILCGLGIEMILNKKPAVDDPNDYSDPEPVEKTPFQDIVKTFAVTMTNPGTIFAFIAIFAGFGITSYADRPVLALIMVAGVFAGSLSWWAGLSWGVSHFAKHIDKDVQHKINLISGGIILFFAMVAFGSLLFE